MQHPNSIEFFLLIIAAMLCGLAVRFALGFAKQTWAMTYHHTMSYALLPVVTMIITVLISGNIALSLGMIGALSIVRFRNPVKNPFELVIFFALITIGIGFLGNRFKNNQNFILLVTKTLIGITIFQEIFDYSNRYFNGTMYLWQDLPLHICNYILFISVIALYSKNKYLFNFCYFNAFSGALIANITPDLEGITGDAGLIFFFLHHFLIIINIVWMIFAFDMIYMVI